MKIIIAVNHPAHYHLFKNLYRILTKKGHQIIFVIKDKDILEQLMISEGVKFVRILKKDYGSRKISILIKGLRDIFKQGFKLFSFARTFKPELMIGTDYSIAHVGKLLGIDSIVFNEDDYEINKFFCNLTYPFCDWILSPEICNVGRFEKKRIGYNGYQKLAYLHPHQFKPEREILYKYIPQDIKYFLIRLVSFSAGHDVEKKHGGLKNSQLEKIINILSLHGQVYITSETKIPDQFKNMELKIDVKDIHHILAFADLFIADSQSMIVEAAMLGTPSIRFNSFVGKISVLNELENKYSLTTGVNNNDPDVLIKVITDHLKKNLAHKTFLERRKKMISEKIDVNSFFCWLIDNYPQSIKIIKQNPAYQYNFK